MLDFRVRTSSRLQASAFTSGSVASFQKASATKGVWGTYDRKRREEKRTLVGVKGHEGPPRRAQGFLYVYD